MAERFLTDLGFRVIERNLRSARGEIDLVAYEGDLLVFIEVKTRRDERFGRPEEAVGPRKQARLVRLASAYLARKRLSDRTCRFDLVSVRWRDSRRPVIELMRDAFRA